MIKEARIKKGYTQEGIARFLNIPLTSYRNIEKYEHEPKVLIALALCKELNLDPYDTFKSSFFTRSDSPTILNKD